MSNTQSSAPVAGSATHDGDFTATMTINASPDRVFEALISPAAIAKWWVPASGGGTAGEELIIHFGDTRAIFRVDEATRASRVQWAVLDCAVEHDWDGTDIIFELSPLDDAATRLDFRHRGLTAQLECFEMCQNGWAEHLGYLVNYVEAGR